MNNSATSFKKAQHHIECCNDSVWLECEKDWSALLSDMIKIKMVHFEIDASHEN